MRGLHDLLEIGLVGGGHDDGRTLGREGAHAAGMVHVVVGENEILDRLARILGFGGVDHPLRLALISRCVEHRETVLHVDDQVVGTAALNHLDIGRKFDELEAAAWREIDCITVGEAAEEDAPQHPLVGNVGGRRRLRRRFDGIWNREGCGCNRSIRR